MGTEGQRRKAELLQTIKCFSVLREQAQQCFHSECPFSVDLNDVSAMILSQKKRPTQELYQRQIQWPLEQKFMMEMLEDVKRSRSGKEN